MSLSFDMTVKTPNGQEKSLGRYMQEQAVVGFVIARLIYCLCPLSGALLGAAAAASHVIRNHLPESHNQYCSSEIQKTALLAASFFGSMFCVSLLTAPPISYLQGLIVMMYVHNMGEDTINKLVEIKGKLVEKIKEPLQKKPDCLS